MLLKQRKNCYGKQSNETLHNQNQKSLLRVHLQKKEKLELQRKEKLEWINEAASNICDFGTIVKKK